MEVALIFKVQLHFMHELKDAMLHRNGCSLNVMLFRKRIARFHERFNSGIDVFRFYIWSRLVPFLFFSYHERFSASSCNSFSFRKGGNIFIQSSPVGMSYESYLAILVDQGAVWDLPHSEVLWHLACIAFNVIVLHAGQTLSLNRILVLAPILINT